MLRKLCLTALAAAAIFVAPNVATAAPTPQCLQPGHPPAHKHRRHRRPVARMACGASRFPTTYGGFSAARPMPAGTVPYTGGNDPWNTPVPPSPVLATNWEAMVAYVRGWETQPEGTNLVGEWSHPIVYASVEDPLYTIHINLYPNAEGSADTIHVPEAAQPAQAGDGHLGVVEPDGSEYDFWQVTEKVPGRIVANGGGKLPGGIAGEGNGSVATGGGFGLMAGTIRSPELEAGSIPHALFSVIGNSAPCATYPSTHYDGTDGSAPFCEGQRFYLEYTPAEVEALPIPAYRKAFVAALARYGFYVGDKGGSGWDFQLEASVMYTAFGLANPFVAQGLPSTLDLASGVDWSRLRALAKWNGS